MKWAELTWPEFERADKKVAVLPVGVVEAHGIHLPLGTDALMAIYVAERAAEGAGVLLLPPIWYGTTYVLDKFPGTISISAETLYRLYKEVFLEAARNGVKYLVVVNGHGGNIDALRMAAKEISKTTELTVIVINWWIDLAKEARRKVLQTLEGHAAEDETSEMMAAYPHLVKEMPRDADEWVETKYAVYGSAAYQQMYKKAVQGYPSKAAREKGEVILRAAVEELKSLLEYLKRDTLPIYKRQ
ncbi:creatininase family protein [Pyrobaculum aerophilum]|uniref:Creatininase n=1 Tax=Pyrobaculum aerophilum TaxID=13773 RepID=A0A371R272_9CREN|nr:creatininase family protein [Pyrobaculum aerophilum]RFA97622.1 creatininase [Pyrobaculum aerophilum]RFA98060.1 creatininase [Pyrobaculum aerophilum]